MPSVLVVRAGAFRRLQPRASRSRGFRPYTWAGYDFRGRRSRADRVQLQLDAATLVIRAIARRPYPNINLMGRIIKQIFQISDEKRSSALRVYRPLLDF
jgi:hypothetical protein